MSKESESRRTESGRWELAAQYLVGCGGGRSVVRKQLGVEFPGVEPTVVGRMGDVKLAPMRTRKELDPIHHSRLRSS